MLDIDSDSDDMLVMPQQLARLSKGGILEGLGQFNMDPAYDYGLVVSRSPSMRSKYSLPQQR
jgi:hypothetical protein